MLIDNISDVSCDKKTTRLWLLRYNKSTTSQNSNHIRSICCGFVVVHNKSTTNPQHLDMSWCCGFVVQLSTCCGFVVQQAVQQIHNTLNKWRLSIIDRHVDTRSTQENILFPLPAILAWRKCKSSNPLWTIHISSSLFMCYVLRYKVLHDTAPRYLEPLTCVADIPGRRALRSASTNLLDVPYFKLFTIGGRAFSVAASQIWNSLPGTVVSASTLQSFQHQLKTFPFQRSFIR